MVDVFLCCDPIGRPETPEWIRGIRIQMSILCERRWKAEKGADIHIITPYTCKAHGLEMPFQQARRMYADEMSASGIYVVADDDCLLTCDPTLLPVVEIMEQNPNIGILALKHGVLPMVRADVPADQLYQNDDVIESHAVGGVRFCRKGIIEEWPDINPKNPYQYDSQHGPAVAEAGYISAYTKAYSMMHIGSTYSMTWAGASWRFWEGTDDKHAVKLDVSKARVVKRWWE
jgi:hypothetical protein